MVKLLFLCRRRPDIDHARYATLLLDGHVPLALRHHPTLRRYVVSLVDEASPGAPPLDSIGALWFETLADYEERLYDSPAGARVIAHDVAGFLAGADAYVTREDGRAGPPPGGEKIVVCLDATEKRPRADAVTSVVERRLATGPVYAAIVEVYGATLEAATEAYRGAAGLVHAYRVREHVARW